MIPEFNLSGVLPPFIGDSSANPVASSPYTASIVEVAHELCTTQERAELFRGLLRYRADLVGSGIGQGVQWLDGSFCEAVEKIRGRPPNDIDIVTLFQRPTHLQDPLAWHEFITANMPLLSRAMVKATYHCDAFFVDAGLPAHAVLPQITYWFGLFTHQRESHLWKGILAVPLSDDDATALKYIDMNWPLS